MATQEIEQLVDDIPRRLRSYRGPLDLSWVAAGARQWGRAASTESSAVDTDSVVRILHELQGWIDGAPRRGMPAYLYPVLSQITQRIFQPCPVQLVLLPGFRGGSFHAGAMLYWQAFRGESPYMWDRSEYRLVEGDWPAGADVGPPPGLCVMLYSSNQQENGLLWPAAAHEIGHYVYETLQAICLADTENNWLYGFVDQTDDLRLFDPSLAQVAHIPDDMTPNRIAAKTASNWFRELFCDLFAAMLFGPSYALTLRCCSQMSTTVELTHPPLALRLDVISPIVADQLEYVPPQLVDLVSTSVDSTKEMNGEEASPSSCLPPGHPVVEYLSQQLGSWRSICRPIIDGLLRDTGCPRWHSDLPPDAVQREVENLISMLLCYVPPVGQVGLRERQSGRDARILSVEPSLPGPIFLAAAAVRFSDDHWRQFREPWEREGEPASAKIEEALFKLLVKALADSHVQRELASGSERPGDSWTARP